MRYGVNVCMTYTDHTSRSKYTYLLAAVENFSTVMACSSSEKCDSTETMERTDSEEIGKFTD